MIKTKIVAGLVASAIVGGGIVAAAETLVHKNIDATTATTNYISKSVSAMQGANQEIKVLGGEIGNYQKEVENINNLLPNSTGKNKENLENESKQIKTEIQHLETQKKNLQNDINNIQKAINKAVDHAVDTTNGQPAGTSNNNPTGTSNSNPAGTSNSNNPAGTTSNNIVTKLNNLEQAYDILAQQMQSSTATLNNAVTQANPTISELNTTVANAQKEFPANNAQLSQNNTSESSK